MKGEGSDSFAFVVSTVPDVCPILREGHEIRHSAVDSTPDFHPYLFGKSGVCPMCARQNPPSIDATPISAAVLIDGVPSQCSHERMEADDDYLSKKRARLLAIIKKESPARKPGARMRAWVNDRAEALRELRRLDAGGPVEDDEGPL